MGTSTIQKMTLQNAPWQVTDALLLSLWVFAYFILIRMFGAVQRLERVFANSTQTKKGGSLQKSGI
jgi:hypothetical protein